MYAIRSYYVITSYSIHYTKLYEDLSAPDWPAFCREPGLIVAGRLTDPSEAEAIRALARTLGWPLRNNFV